MTENKRIKMKAIVLGVLIDIGASTIIGSFYGIILSITMAVRGVPLNEIMVHLQGSVLLLLIPSLIIGFGSTILGGFIAGRIAKQSQVLHGGIVGGIGTPFGLFLYSSFPLWFNIISFLGIIPMGMLGGYLSRQHKRKDT